ncbi:quinone-dependent dihydroorotate dehydrogenase [Chelativorans sp. M5D2P16]|uniref:quinone-dependent dihydroorotate dehydrogenase n=1 Tax=Chelativorans sp. M5D2P16 TaxID=3095678 RepID=UPI002ACA170A|nr:quinone-dependent dihydroorotate dehydrogenase [Chelativorans sp. M5D2P16]MDZ5697099.1 quinone-dependent dihydroorotate dehydrogenase [Chelativorans sp. M5D2P16]
MKRLLDLAARPLLFRLDPERAHGLSIAALKSGVRLSDPPPVSRKLSLTLAGLDFPNPLGVAAGYDKNAEVPDALLKLGFGFAECGTITPRPQAGNPKPRIFRLAEDEAVINRLGFNNEGHQSALARLLARAPQGGVVGVNIGANRDSADRMADYEEGVRLFAGVASYLTINISSPNTAGLRALQDRESLAELLERVMRARNAQAAGLDTGTPVFLKIAPDLSDEAMADISAEVLDKRVDGLIVSNTTLARAGLKSAAAHETGGLSGAPLFERSTIVLARMRKLIGPWLPIIGVGGVRSAETALEKMRAGADLVQLYTGMIYQGPGLAARILRGLDTYAEREGLSSIAEIRDSRVEEWAARRLD